MYVTEQQAAGEQAGVIYGSAASTHFDFAVTDPGIRRLDYVAAETADGTICLGQVMQLKRESNLSFDDALALGDEDYELEEKVTAQVQVIGFRDDRGLLQVPRVPFRAGTGVSWADEALIQNVLGLGRSPETGAYIGMLKGTQLPVNLNVNTLVQKHMSVLAKTGAGKSYCTGVVLEELLKKDVAIVIVDAHDEYHSLTNPNIEDSEVDRLIKFGLKPKGFMDKLVTWTTEMNHRPGTSMLKLEGTAMSANDIVDLLGGKVTGAQQGILFQAIKDARLKNPLYSLRDVIDQCHGNKSNSKWNVISALETLDATGMFTDDGRMPEDVVQPGKASIVSLKGVSPDIQEIVVARLASMLFEARKATEVPPFLFVVEEAHNYCPERGIGNAVSLPILRTIASEGRKFGMGLCVVSQRPAKVDKNILSQCNTQVILKVTNPNDLKALVGSVEGLTSSSADEIARLPVGVALIAGGDLGMPIMVDVRTRQSRHGGASVDIVGKDVPKPTPRMKPSPQRQTVVEEAPVAAPAKTTKPEPKPEAKPAAADAPADGAYAAPGDVVGEGGPSERPIQWGAGRTRSEGWKETRGKGPQVEDPVVREVRRERHNDDKPTKKTKAEPAPAPVEPPKPMEPREARIHRVANRVGYVATLKSEETMDLLRKAAARAGVSPQTYLDPFANVGASHCHRDNPRCYDNCPLAPRCAFKKKRDAKGHGRDHGRDAGGGHGGGNGNGGPGDAGRGGVLGRFFGRK